MPDHPISPDHSLPPPRTVSEALQRAREYLRARRAEEAIHCFEWTLNREPEHFGANQGIAMAYAMKGDVDNAALFLVIATQIRPHDWQPHYQLAKLYHRQGRMEESGEALHEAYLLNPGIVQQATQDGLMGRPPGHAPDHGEEASSTEASSKKTSTPESAAQQTTA